MNVVLHPVVAFTYICCADHNFHHFTTINESKNLRMMKSKFSELQSLPKPVEPLILPISSNYSPMVTNGNLLHLHCHPCGTKTFFPWPILVTKWVTSIFLWQLRSSSTISHFLLTHLSLVLCSEMLTVTKMAHLTKNGQTEWMFMDLTILVNLGKFVKAKSA